MNWTTKGVAALATGITLFCGMGTVTAMALTGHHTTTPAAAADPARPAAPVAPAPAKMARPTPAPTKTIIVQQPPAPAAAQPASALRYVGNGIYAGPNTSDAFAQNVVSAWSGTPGVQYVYSPVTGQTYAMTYQVVGAGTVIATGGNGAYVQF